MAAGPWQVFRRAKPKEGNGTTDYDTHTFKMALTTDAQALTDDFAGASTDCRYADLTAEVPNGGGYTTGGKTLAVTYTRAGDTVTYDCDDQAWGPGAMIEAKYAVVYNDSSPNKDLVCFCELDTVSSIAAINGTLTVAINASGVFNKI
jgi:hypothetical protein